MRRVRGQDSAVMLGLLGILAYAGSMMTHEALGHGGYCMAAGGRTVALTAWWETCRFAGAPRLMIKAAGPAVQFGAGLLLWLVLRRSSWGAGRWRYFLWLSMVVDLLVSSGYVAFSGVTGLGDAAELVAGLRPAALWRVGLVLVGGAVYCCSLRVAAGELKRLAGADGTEGRLFRMVWLPYVSAGVFATGTGVLTQVANTTGLAVAAPGIGRSMGHAAAIVQAVASSFGAMSGMLSFPAIGRGMAGEEGAPMVYVRWSAAWVVAGVLVIASLLGFLFGFSGSGFHRGERRREGALGLRQRPYNGGSYGA